MMSFECHLDLAIWWGCLADLFPPMSWVYSCSWNSLGVIYRLDGGEVPASFVWESFSIFGRTLFLFAYLRVVFLQFGHVVGFFLSNLITWFKLRVVKLRRCCKKEYYKNRVFVGILFLVLCSLELLSIPYMNERLCLIVNQFPGNIFHLLVSQAANPFWAEFNWLWNVYINGNWKKWEKSSPRNNALSAQVYLVEDELPMIWHELFYFIL